MSDQTLSATVLDRRTGQESPSELLAHCYRNAIDQLNSCLDKREPLAIMMDKGRAASDFVLRTFLSSLDEDVAVARVTEHCVDATDLMRKIIDAAGFQPKDMGLSDLESVFSMFLSFQKCHKRRTVVCIEELQDSEWWVLDRIRTLVESEVENQYGMLVIICGQSGFKEVLNSRPLSSISALAGKRIRLAPFTLTQTTECIRQQIEEDGSATVGQVFQYQAIPLIHELSGGVPDAVKALVTQSLQTAEREGVELVTASIVKRAYEYSSGKTAPEKAGATDDTVAFGDIKSPMRRLIIRMAGVEAREQALRQGHTLIGRSDLCDIRIFSRTVSRHHALITYGDKGATLVDLDSTNGTFVDGYQITRLDLTPGDSIMVGNCQIEYMVDDELQSASQTISQRCLEAH